MIKNEFPGRTLSGIGGIETGNDAAQFILLGCDTVQVCTGVMKFGYDIVKPMQEQLLAFMEKHKFNRIEDFKGHSAAILHDARRSGKASGRGACGQEGRARSPEDDPQRRRMGRRRLRQADRRPGTGLGASGPPLRSMPVRQNAGPGEDLSIAEEGGHFPNSEKWCLLFR